MKKVVPFAKARATSLYGSKAVGLGEAARHGLTVPPGVALSGDLVEAIASGEHQAVEKVTKAIANEQSERYPKSKLGVAHTEPNFAIGDQGR